MNMSDFKQLVRDVLHQLALEFRGTTDVSEICDLDAMLFAAVEGNRTDVAANLLDRGAHIAAVDEHGVNPLMTAARGNRPGMVSLLLKRGAGADVGNQNVLGTALAEAAMRGHTATVQALLEAEPSRTTCQIVEGLVEKYGPERFERCKAIKDLLVSYRVNRERDLLNWAAGVDDQEPAPPARRRM